VSDRQLSQFVAETREELRVIKEAFVSTNFESLTQVGILQGRARELISSLRRLERIIEENIDE
jgi:hypothetical protein